MFLLGFNFITNIQFECSVAYLMVVYLIELLWHSKIYLIFHISLLKPCHGDLSSPILLLPLQQLDLVDKVSLMGKVMLREAHSEPNGQQVVHNHKSRCHQSLLGTVRGWSLLPNNERTKDSIY